MRRTDIAPPTEAEHEISNARWRTALRLAGGAGATVWLLLSFINDQVVVSGILAANGSAAQVTEAHVTTLVNCAVAVGLCIALYVLSTVGE